MTPVAAIEHPVPAKTGPTTSPASRIERRLSWLSVALMASLSAGGLFVARIYEESDAVIATFRGYDLVTLLVAVPILMITLSPAWRSSDRARLVRAGILGFAAYTYAYYIFGLSFNDLFLGHVAVFTLTAVTLGFTVRSLYPTAARWSGLSARTASLVLVLLGVSLAAMWISGALGYVFNGTEPRDGSLLVGNEVLTHLGYTMDLAVLVPAYVAAAIGLWRRRPWGLVIAGVVLVAGAISQLTYVSALVFQYVENVDGAPGFDPYEPFILAAYLVAAWSVFRAFRTRVETVVPKR
jgi:hypothetical protein